MALWGLTDNLEGAPKWLTKKDVFAGTAVATSTITVAQHSFVNGSKVTWTNDTGLTGTDVASGIKYVKVLTNNTIELYGNAALNANKLTADNTAGTNHSIQVTPDDVYYVDATEAALAGNRKKGLTTPGWYQFVQKNAGEFTTGGSLSTVAISNVNGRLTCAANTISIGDKITITGADGGSNVLGDTYDAEDGVDYLVSAINTGTEGRDVTEFTVTEADGTAVTNFVVTVIGSMPATLAFALNPSVARSQPELLCAIGDPIAVGTYSGDRGVDGNDDAVVEGGLEAILISTAPLALTGQVDTNAAAFIVTVNSSTTPAFQWSRATTVDGTYSNINDDGATNQNIVATTGSGDAITSTLTITDNGGNNGATPGASGVIGAEVFFKCTITAADATTVVTTPVALSVTGA